MPKPLLERFFVLIGIFGIFVLGIFLYGKSPSDTAGKLEVSYLNVGQGDAELIKTPKGKFVLIDGGPDKSVLSELGKKMPPYNKEIEAVILTHPHADHVTGLNYVLDRYRVHKIYLTGVVHTAPEYISFLKKIKEQGTPAEKLYLGKDFALDEVNFKTVWPLSDVQNIKFKDLNESSIANFVSYGKTSFLFLGDLSAKSQDQMLKKLQLPHVNVLKIAHHGSKTGTSNNLLVATDPKYAVIEVGKDNDFGHPAPTTLNLLSGRITLRTDQLGTISLVSDGNVLTTR